MIIYANDRYVSSSRKFYCVIFVFIWIFGILFGSCLLKPSLSPLMCSVFSQPVSIVGLFAIFFLPLILCYFSILLNKPLIILTVCFFKAVAFGFSGILIYQTFSSAAWVAFILFLFPDYCSVLSLIILGLRYFLDAFQGRSVDFISCCFAGLLISIADLFVISPFWEGLF